MDAKDEHHIDFLYRALNDAQETIRSTDAKAEIVIVLVGGVLAFIGAIHGRIDTLPFTGPDDYRISPCADCRSVRHLGAQPTGQSRRVHRCGWGETAAAVLPPY